LEYIITSLSALWTKSGNDLYYTTGNIGIGTTTPTSLLEIDGNNAITVNNNGNVNALFIKDNSVSKYAIDYVSSDGKLGVYNYVDTSYSMKIQDDGDIEFSGGNVGIGTTAPAAPFDVTSNVTDNSMVAINSNAGGYGPFFQGGGWGNK
ncbi:MAG: hypothetical protein U9P50_02130, partial [Patescibacteria group bacterium]|nr:hypothetical protein [Patescibacteria group bacterium]